MPTTAPAWISHAGDVDRDGMIGLYAAVYLTDQILRGGLERRWPVRTRPAR